MKKLLLLSSFLLFCLTWSCDQKTTKEAKTDTASDQIHKPGVPDQATLDS